MTYTIHYQNTGTDSTYFIIVKDTLSQFLNPSTVRNLASSDRYSSFGISGTGILTWTFNPLSLPSISTDSIASNGFIMYSVKKMDSMPLGAVITNSATIYFDYNNGVITNTTIDTQMHVVDTPLSIRRLQPAAYNVSVYPNPNNGNFIVAFSDNGVKEVSVTDMLGQTVVPAKRVLMKYEFDLSLLADGVYLLRVADVRSSNSLVFKQLVIQK